MVETSFLLTLRFACIIGSHMGISWKEKKEKKKIVEIHLQVVVAYLKLLDIEVHLDEDG